MRTWKKLYGTIGATAYNMGNAGLDDLRIRIVFSAGTKIIFFSKPPRPT
jgi:hypothetical protein